MAEGAAIGGLWLRGAGGREQRLARAAAADADYLVAIFLRCQSIRPIKCLEMCDPVVFLTLDSSLDTSLITVSKLLFNSLKHW